MVEAPSELKMELWFKLRAGVLEWLWPENGEHLSDGAVVWRGMPIRGCGNLAQGVAQCFDGR